MRSKAHIFIVFATLSGCAGNLADRIGPRAGIIADELPRYGLNLRESRCLSEQLGATLTPLQIRRFKRSAAAVRQGYFDPDRLTMRDLTYVASQQEDPQVAAQLAAAAETCEIGADQVVAVEIPVRLPTQPDSASPTQTGPGQPSDSAATTRRTNWLNLGAAASGQTIAVDASSFEQDGYYRRAWFRLTDPGSTDPNPVTYLLRVDCTARTINSMASGRRDATGALIDYRDFGPTGEGVMPIEAGTVMEIAWLALCT